MRKIGLNGGVQILLCRSTPVYNEMTPFLHHIKDSIQTCQLINGYLKLDVLKRRPLVRSLNLHQIQKKINQGLLNMQKQFACLIRQSRIKLNSNFVGRKIVLLLYKVKYQLPQINLNLGFGKNSTSQRLHGLNKHVQSTKTHYSTLLLTR